MLAGAFFAHKRATGINRKRFHFGPKAVIINTTRGENLCCPCKSFCSKSGYRIAKEPFEKKEPTHKVALFHKIKKGEKL